MRAERAVVLAVPNAARSVKYRTIQAHSRGMRGGPAAWSAQNIYRLSLTDALRQSTSGLVRLPPNGMHRYTELGAATVSANACKQDDQLVSRYNPWYTAAKQR